MQLQSKIGFYRLFLQYSTPEIVIAAAKTGFAFPKPMKLSNFGFLN